MLIVYIFYDMIILAQWPEGRGCQCSLLDEMTLVLVATLIGNSFQRWAGFFSFNLAYSCSFLKIFNPRFDYQLIYFQPLHMNESMDT